jgi:hypothetical protein
VLWVMCAETGNRTQDTTIFSRVHQKEQRYSICSALWLLFACDRYIFGC